MKNARKLFVDNKEIIRVFEENFEVEIAEIDDPVWDTEENAWVVTAPFCEGVRMSELYTLTTNSDGNLQYLLNVAAPDYFPQKLDYTQYFDFIGKIEQLQKKLEQRLGITYVGLENMKIFSNKIVITDLAQDLEKINMAKSPKLNRKDLSNF